MKQLNLDLDQSGQKNLPAMPVAGPSTDKPYYPSFHHEGEVDWEDAGITDEGTMTIRYCITRSTEIKAEDKPDVYTYDVEIREIVSVEPEKDEKPAKSYSKATEDSLDKLAAAAMKKANK